MTIISAYQDAGTYRGAAAICGTTPKTVKRVIQRAEAGGVRPEPKLRARNYEVVLDLVAERMKKSAGRISATRLLPPARTAKYVGSDRNFRRLIAQAKKDWRVEHHRGRRPAIWSPGEHLVIDWGSRGGVHVFCAVLAWSRWRFVRFAADEKSTTTLAMLGECFAELGGVPPAGSDHAPATATVGNRHHGHQTEPRVRHSINYLARQPDRRRARKPALAYPFNRS